MPKKTYADFKAVKQAVSMVLVLDYYGITDCFERSDDGLGGSCIHEGAAPTQFRVSISKNAWHCVSEYKRGDTYVAKYVPIGNRTPSTEELGTEARICFWL